MLIKLSVAFMIKGEMPNENTLPSILPSRCIQFLRIFREVFFPSKKDMTQAALSPCDITVAIAAPLTPR